MSTYTLEQYIKKHDLKYYKYDEFNDIEEIGGGLVGKVYKANWKQNGKCLVLKSFSLNNVKEIIYEVRV
ncbi:hypothetical protein RhiirC2_756530 [Rhizophagus irregularis]|uniref:Protein kinase domain-containing protein n=1 Tax=Rhizophagus irregularis TaxID=588596 RepID=A0A2N1MSC4_9GLOM|nr:hypothetical protein RhiirC2_756530 [Rhizophagus irregularis]